MDVQNPEERIVLEVQGYARGRQILDKKLVRVRVNGGSYRKAKSPNFGKAVLWLAEHGYRLAETARPKQHMGTLRVRYVYVRREPEPEPEPDPTWEAMRRQAELEAVMLPYSVIHHHGISEEAWEYADWCRDGRV